MIESGKLERIIPRAAHASGKASAVAVAASSAPSTSICRASRPPLAPSASRTENSRSRSVFRASRRLATLAQATSSSTNAAICHTAINGPAPSIAEAVGERPHADFALGMAVRERAALLDEDRLQTLLRGGHGYAGREPAHHRQVPLIAFGLRLGRQHQWRPHVRAVRHAEAGRHHSDHLARDACQRELLAKHVRTRAELAPPELIPQHDDRDLTGGVGGGQCAAQQWRLPEDLEQLRRDEKAGELLWRSVEKVLRVPPFDRGQPIEDVARLLAPIEEISRRDRFAIVEALM